MARYEWVCPKCGKVTETKTMEAPECCEKMKRVWSATPRVWKCDKGGQA